MIRKPTLKISSPRMSYPLAETPALLLFFEERNETVQFSFELRRIFG